MHQYSGWDYSSERDWEVQKERDREKVQKGGDAALVQSVSLSVKSVCVYADTLQAAAVLNSISE